MSTTVDVPVASMPVDPELAAALAKVPLPDLITVDMVPAIRQAGFMGIQLTAESVLAEVPAPYGHHETTIARPDGGEIILSIFTPKAVSSEPRPCIYLTHGGGMVLGNRFVGAADALGWAADVGGVVASVEYRLAPEHPDPVPVEDCYAGLAWLSAHAAELGIDPDKVLIAGPSAGGGLAAGVALLARDRGGPALCGQLLLCPMLDDRFETVSSKQVPPSSLWGRQSNMTGWTALLGARVGGAEVSIYAAPGRATDLSGLPPTFIDVGSADIFRDDDVAYAQKLWAHGVPAELHVWPGGYHGFESIAPVASLSIACVAARRAWIKRLFKPWTPSTIASRATVGCASGPS